MNKLFIIGNGFDLAHGYPTAYSDFVKWIWNSIQSDIKNPKFRKLLEINDIYCNVVKQGLDINCYDDFKKSLNLYCEGGQSYTHLHNAIYATLGRDRLYTFNNRFFLVLSLKYPNANWSDIESLFYEILINVLENRSVYGINIDSLNADMEIIKDLFSEYLLENVKYSNLQRVNTFTKLLEYAPKYVSTHSTAKEVNDYLNEFPENLHARLRRFDRMLVNVEEKGSWEGLNEIPNTLILDFNYTSTVKSYLSLINSSYYIYGNVEHIKIHGDLTNSENPINLGFGDEMDDHYKELEKKNDNRYLKYIKSFMYSNNTNYRKMLNWIESNDFQVYILGHSCGLSDRIMLNTIFEKDRCKSIKVFYYEWEQDGKVYDDFTDKIQNISRHFNKKALMREKLVDKSLSRPLKVI